MIGPEYQLLGSVLAHQKKELASEFAVSASTLRRWESGAVKVPGPVARAIRCVSRDQIATEWLSVSDDRMARRLLLERYQHFVGTLSDMDLARLAIGSTAIYYLRDILLFSVGGYDGSAPQDGEYLAYHIGEATTPTLAMVEDWLATRLGDEARTMMLDAVEDNLLDSSDRTLMIGALAYGQRGDLTSSTVDNLNDLWINMAQHDEDLRARSNDR